MDAAVWTGLVGAACGPALARAVYQLSVDFGTPARTACRHCGEPLPTGAVRFPLWSGHCRQCKGMLGPRVWLVTIVAALGAAVTGHRIGYDPSTVVFTVFALGCVLLAFVDIAVRRLPDSVTLPLAAMGFVGLGTTSYLAQDMTPLYRGLIGAALAGGFFLALAWVRPDGEGMGLGDAKLAGVLGLFLGWLSWADLVLGILAGTTVAAVFGIYMVRSGRMDRKSALTYGPFLLLGAAIALIAGL